MVQPTLLVIFQKDLATQLDDLKDEHAKTLARLEDLEEVRSVYAPRWVI